jgi:hypothetical protein
MWQSCGHGSLMTIPSLQSIARVALLGLLSIALAACDTPGGTIREIRAHLEVFKKTPNMATLEQLDASFDKIEAQIRELEKKSDIVRGQARLEPKDITFNRATRAIHTR